MKAINMDCIAKGEELPIDIVDYASLLLNQVPPSLLLVRSAINIERVTEKKTQIHYINQHYLVSHYDGTKIIVYDSLRNPSHVHLLNCQLRDTYSDIFFSPNEVVYEVPQCQTNSVDCGLYAIGFATLLRNGLNPCEVNLDSVELRPHLLECFRDGELRCFPLRKKN